MSQYTALLCVRPPDLTKPEYVPMKIGVIGLYKSHQEARNALIALENKAEFRDFKLMTAFAPIINTDKDIRYPVGYEVAEPWFPN